MGITITDEITTRFGLKVTNAYASFRGNYNIMKLRYNKMNQVNTLYEPMVCYKVVGVAGIWVNKEAYENDQHPLVNDIGIESGELTQEDIEAHGGLLKNVMYPKLKETLGFQNYADD